MKWKIVPTVATAEMLEYARDWSYVKYGKPIGDDAASGCLNAMLAAAKPYVVTDEDVAEVADAAMASLPLLDHVSHKVTRAVLEAFVRRLGGGE